MVWRMGSNGDWERYFDPASIDPKASEKGGFLLSGPFLFYVEEGYVALQRGTRIPYKVIAIDLRSRKAVREFTWSMTTGN
jgi:hypothetical protein